MFDVWIDAMPMRNSVKTTLCLLSALLHFTHLNAQSSFNNLSVNVQQYYGSLVAIVPKTTYIRDSYSSFTEINFSRQTDGSKDWHRHNNYPQTGISFFYGNPGSKKYAGKSISLFPFVNFSFIRKKNFKSSFRAGTGISWIEKPYDVNSNHKNTLIGSHLNNIIHLMQQNEIRLNNSLSVNAGFAFIHISNGGVKLPNFGLNIPTLSAGLRYTFNEKISKDSSEITIDKRPKIRLLASLGAKQTPWAGSPRYVVGFVGTEIVKPVSGADDIGGGLDVFYDPSLTKDPSGYIKTSDKTENLQVGVHAFYARKIGRLSIPLQVGVYIINPSKRSGIYQNVGLRYKLSKHLSAFYYLKTHAGKADYIHGGVGYLF
jgi:hypothetical protein